MQPSMSVPDSSPAVRTAAQLLDLPRDGHRYELVHGELRRSMAAGFRHGELALRIATSLYAFVRDHDLGTACAAETGFRLADDHVRAPDAAFVRKERVAEAGAVDGFWPGAPDLAVEVVSPSDRYTDVEEKVADWLQAGASMVIVVNERRRTVTVVRSTTDVALLGAADVIDGGDVVPGWKLAVAELFA